MRAAAVETAAVEIGERSCQVWRGNEAILGIFLSESLPLRNSAQRYGGRDRGTAIEVSAGLSWLPFGCEAVFPVPHPLGWLDGRLSTVCRGRATFSPDDRPFPPYGDLLMTRLFLLAALACLMSAPVALADAGPEDSDKGLCKGDAIGAFYVTKVAGAEDDGVPQGEDLCYRCRYGQRPMVMVFARTTDGQVAKLVEKLDAAVADQKDLQLKSFVTLIGDSSEKLTDQAKKIAQQSSPKNVPIVVANDAQSGPRAYKLSDSEVTVVLASDSQVVARHEFAADQIDITAVMKGVKQMLR